RTGGCSRGRKEKPIEAKESRRLEGPEGALGFARALRSPAAPRKHSGALGGVVLGAGREAALHAVLRQDPRQGRRGYALAPRESALGGARARGRSARHS